MRFLVDANLSPHVAAWLRSQGHDAAHVFELDLAEAPDEQILALAVQESRILLTSDLDFGEIHARSADSVSVVILRLRSHASARVIARLGQALAPAGPALETGAIVTIGEARLRIRRLPVV
jgi:predicted nuclease of predicted toxin-antitoxin system